jgi:hypothetical protein
LLVSGIPVGRLRHRGRPWWGIPVARVPGVVTARSGTSFAPGDRGLLGVVRFVHDSAARRVDNACMPTWSDAVRIATALPEVEESTWFRSPSLAVRGRSFARLRTEAEGGMVLVCGLDEKEALLSSGDPAFYTTPHYDGYGAILVDLDLVARQQLTELVEDAWRIKAPVRLRKAFDAGRW